MDNVAIVTLLIIIIVVAVVARHNYQPGTSINTYSVTQPPTEIIAGATMQMATKGYTVTHTSDVMATFSRTQEPHRATGCALLLLGIIPGLLYFGLFRRTMTTTISAISRATGTEIVLSGDDTEGRRVLARWIENTFYSIN